MRHKFIIPRRFLLMGIISFVFIAMCSINAISQCGTCTCPSGGSWPFGTQEPPVVAGTKLYSSIKWCGITEAPAVVDPCLVCRNTGDWKTMMWRRHERASEAIWIPQCRITLRSGGAVQKSDYVRFNDLDVSMGTVAGDIVAAIQMGPNLVLAQELDDTWRECDMQWAAQPKGIISINANRLFVDNGAGVLSQIRGVALTGSITMPYMAMADPTIFCQANERSLAHEFGHVLGLGHVTTAGLLMQTGGTGATLTTGECNSTRTYLSNNTILDPPPNQGVVDLVDFIYDTGEDDGEAAFLDIRKTVVTDDSPNQGDLFLCLGLKGLLGPDTSATYWMALDVDNDPGSGGLPAQIIPNVTMGGVELVAEVKVEQGVPTPTLYRQIDGDLFEVVDIPGQIIAGVRDIGLFVCDPEPNYQGPDSAPVFSEIDFRFTTEALATLGFMLGAEEGLFPNGLMMQSAAAQASTDIVDFSPDEGGVLDLPAIHFPSIAVNDCIAIGETITVGVGGMPPEVGLMVFMGAFEIAVAEETDVEGNAEFNFVVPPDAPFGPTLLTVGINDPQNPNNAITADFIATIGYLAGDVNSDGLVNSTDALILLSHDAGLNIPPPSLELINAGAGDINTDQNTNSTDALITLSYDAGLSVPFDIDVAKCQ